MNQPSSEWSASYRSGTGKTVRIVVRAISPANAGFLIRMEMAKRFKGKTFTVIDPPKRVKI